MTPVDVLYSNFVKFDCREIGKIERCLADKNKVSPSFLALATAQIVPRINPRECTQSAPGLIQVGSLSAELFPNA